MKMKIKTQKYVGVTWNTPESQFIQGLKALDKKAPAYEEAHNIYCKLFRRQHCDTLEAEVDVPSRIFHDVKAQLSNIDFITFID